MVNAAGSDRNRARMAPADRRDIGCVCKREVAQNLPIPFRSATAAQSTESRLDDVDAYAAGHDDLALGPPSPVHPAARNRCTEAC